MIFYLLRFKLKCASSLMLIGNVKSEELQVKVVQSSYTKPSVRVIHESGATEGPDDGNFDALLLKSPNYPRVNFYSRNIYGGFSVLLRKDGRPLESMTTYNLEFEGEGLPEEGGEIGISYWRDSATNFPGKNIISVIYSSYDDFDSTERLDDAKYLAKAFPYPQVAYTLFIGDGISKRMDVEFYEDADIDMDRRVKFSDFAIFSGNWMRTGIENYTPADPNNYSDINRDGSVDINDLSILVSKWMMDYRGSERSPDSYLPPAPSAPLEVAYANGSKQYTETKTLPTSVDSVTGESVLQDQYLAGFQAEANELF